jgi:glycosyltransferase involved in cell wall biosynthesis
MIAHLVPWKRHDLFVEAAILLRDFWDAEGRPITWIIAGSDLFGEHANYVAALRKRIAAAGLAERFLWLEGRKAAEILPSLGLLVHPTDQEPFGRVICEAMAAGVPVVACDAAGPGSILTDRETGFLFSRQVEGRKSKVESRKSKVAAALAERIRFALTHPEERTAVAKAAQAVVRDRYSIERVSDEITALLKGRQ